MSNNKFRAVVFLILASTLWSTGGVLIKYVDWDPMSIAGTRSGVAAIVMMMYLRRPIRLEKYKVMGAFFYCSTVILFVIANKMTTSANVILLQYTAPIWVALFSGWLLKEKIIKLDWLTIATVMGGMVLFFVGDLETGQMTGNLLSVLSGITLAGVYISLKFAKKASPVEIPLLGNLLSLLVCLPFILKTVPNVQSVIIIIILGVFQLGISYILFAEGSQYISAIEAVLIAVIEPLLNPIWVFLFAKELPSQLAIIGGLVVVFAVITRNILMNRVNKKEIIKQETQSS